MTELGVHRDLATTIYSVEKSWKRKKYTGCEFQISGEGPLLSLELSVDQRMHARKLYHSPGRSHPKGEGREITKAFPVMGLYLHPSLYSHQSE